MVERLSVLGVRLGAASDDAARALTGRGARFKGFAEDAAAWRSPGGTIYVHAGPQGRVLSVAGPCLEVDGQVLLRVAAPAEALLETFGPPESRVPMVADRLVDELEREAPEVARRLGEIMEEDPREFWWYAGGRLAVLVEEGALRMFVLQEHPTKPRESLL